MMLRFISVAWTLEKRLIFYALYSSAHFVAGIAPFKLLDILDGVALVIRCWTHRYYILDISIFLQIDGALRIVDVVIIHLSRSRYVNGFVWSTEFLTSLVLENLWLSFVV